MPEYVVVIDKGGLDTVAEWPKKTKIKITLMKHTALKMAGIIHVFDRGSVSYVEQIISNPKSNILISSHVMSIMKRLEAGATAEGWRTAQAIKAMKTRAITHSQGDYLMLRVKMTENEMKAARTKDSHDGALEVISNATHILHGKKEDLARWMKRMEMEKELKEM